MWGMSMKSEVKFCGITIILSGLETESSVLSYKKYHWAEFFCIYKQHYKYVSGL